MSCKTSKLKCSNWSLLHITQWKTECLLNPNRRQSQIHTMGSSDTLSDLDTQGDIQVHVQTFCTTKKCYNIQIETILYRNYCLHLLLIHVSQKSKQLSKQLKFSQTTLCDSSLIYGSDDFFPNIINGIYCL